MIKCQKKNSVVLRILLSNIVSRTLQETNLLLIEDNSLLNYKLYLKSGGCSEISNVILNLQIITQNKFNNLYNLIIP